MSARTPRVKSEGVLTVRPAGEDAEQEAAHFTSECNECGMNRAAALDLVAVEEVVLFGVGAVRTFQAAEEEDGNGHRHQHGENARIDRKPVKQTIHIEGPYPGEI